MYFGGQWLEAYSACWDSGGLFVTLTFVRRVGIGSRCGFDSKPGG